MGATTPYDWDKTIYSAIRTEEGGLRNTAPTLMEDRERTQREKE
jgi:hypothetical protein